MTQADLAEKIEKATDQVRAIETGLRNPSFDTIARLGLVLIEDSDKRVAVVARWLTKLQEHRVSTAGLEPAQAALLQAAAARVTHALAPARRRLPPSFPRSLEGFPEQFQPLVAVFPDRREVPPYNAADLFILSGAVGDYQYIGHLTRLETPLTIVSDKLFMLRPRDWLAKRFSKAHFLIVGSSSVNWLARTSAALFRPQVDPEARAWHNRYLQHAAKLEDRKLLNVFWHVVETAKRMPHRDLEVDLVPTGNLGRAEVELLPTACALVTEVLDGRTVQEIEQAFKVTGFGDPAHRLQHRPHGTGNDLGVVSFAPHPFDTSGEFVSILCAGIAGPGTALGLRALVSEQKEFAERPFGGVLDVQLPQGQKTWPGRFEEAFWHWRTLPYQPSDVLENLRVAADTSESRRRAVFKDWSEDDRTAAIGFVEQLMGATPPVP